jgi:hypothetical protein
MDCSSRRSRSFANGCWEYNVKIQNLKSKIQNKKGAPSIPYRQRPSRTPKAFFEKFVVTPWRKARMTTKLYRQIIS